MLLMLVILAVIIAVGAVLALVTFRVRDSHRRRLGRARREGKYAARQSNWQSYIGANAPDGIVEEGDDDN